ncbi:MAG: phenylacetate-CoA oxygenase subunit PaaI [Chloroflexi bacterium]|nr:MAG: phenylacetate-CoA oxygenase subunit PaaI [Chloroflexota bacterium]
MNEELKQAIVQKLIALADDELILGHRDSEWTGHAPILEEDIAFANIAQDEIGHAVVWYSLVQELTGQKPDQLAFFRDAPDFRNVQMVELPKEDWAFTMMRQYLFDTAELIWLDSLAQSSYKPVADAANKMRNEEIYHYRHTSTWIKRLGLGTEESHRRIQSALDALWGYALQLFVPLPAESTLVTAGVVPDPAEVQAQWEAQVRPFLDAANLQIPDITTPVTTSRTNHTTHLVDLLAEMQSVARLEPEADW